MKSEIITYTINKNRSSDFYISVQNGEVVVKAPWYVSQNKIQEIVEEKKRWILEKLKEYEGTKDYIRNEVVKILGENCTVKINYKNLKKPTLTVEGKRIKIFLPNKYKKMNREEILILLIEKLYDTIAEKEIERAMEKTRKVLGFAPEDYKIERLTNTLAKCSKDKVIIIHPEIVKYNREVIEYIVLHEFCHLKYKNHSKGFFEMLERYMPNYTVYQKQLEKNIG